MDTGLRRYDKWGDAKGTVNPKTGAIENMEVLFFSTRLLREDLFEIPVEAELHRAK